MTPRFFNLTRWRQSWPVLLIFGLGLLSKCLVIFNVAMTTPNNDQWRVDFETLYGPWLNHQLHWSAFWSPWQEHRLVFQKLYDFGLFLCLRHFDNRLQCVLNGIFHCGLISLLFHGLSRHLPAARTALLAGSVLVVALPFGWENTANGFQAQVYFLLFFLLAAAWCFARGLVLGGFAFSALGMLAQMSGFGTALVYAALVFLQWTRRRTVENFWKFGTSAGIALLLAILAFHLRGEAPWNRPERCRSAWDFMQTYARYLAWPSFFDTTAALFLLAPLALLLAGWRAGTIANSPPVRFVLLGSGSLLLQLAVVAFYRAHAHSAYLSRYQDIAAPMLVLSLAAWFLLPAFRGKQFLAGGWVCAVVLGFVNLMSFAAADGLPHYRAANRIWEQNSIELVRSRAVDEFAKFDPTILPCTNLPDFYRLITTPGLTNLVPAFHNLKPYP